MPVTTQKVGNNTVRINQIQYQDTTQFGSFFAVMASNKYNPIQKVETKVTVRGSRNIKSAIPMTGTKEIKQKQFDVQKMKTLLPISKEGDAALS